MASVVFRASTTIAPISSTQAARGRRLRVFSGGASAGAGAGAVVAPGITAPAAGAAEAPPTRIAPHVGSTAEAARLLLTQSRPPEVWPNHTAAGALYTGRASAIAQQPIGGEAGEADERDAFRDQRENDRRAITRLAEPEQRGLLADQKEDDRYRRHGRARRREQRKELFAPPVAESIERAHQRYREQGAADEVEQEQRPDRRDLGVAVPRVFHEVNHRHCQ